MGHHTAANNNREIVKELKLNVTAPDYDGKRYREIDILVNNTQWETQGDNIYWRSRDSGNVPEIVAEVNAIRRKWLLLR